MQTGRCVDYPTTAQTGMTMKPHKYDLQLWNSMHPVGSPCDLILDDGSMLRTKTRSIAWELGHGQAVVKVEGKSGGWLLERVRIFETHHI